MCRHLAYLGPPVALAALLFDAPHSLRDQAREPRYQPPGRVNPDGWGVAWWYGRADGPSRYRTTTSIWDDDGFDARPTSDAVIAAARRASPGTTARREENNAPFVSGAWAFSLNGYASAGGRGDRLRAAISPARRDALTGDTDSEVLFALALDQLDAGASPGDALASVVEAVAPDDETFLNLLITDGTHLAATRHRNSLFVRRADGLCVASEPLDDDPSWCAVPDGTILSEELAWP